MESTTVLPATTSTTTSTSVVEPALVDGLSLVSSVSPGRIVDEVRPDAILQHGIEGGGDGPNPVGPVGRDFTGDDADIVVNLVAAGESDDLNPAGSVFVFQVEGLTLTKTAHELLVTNDSRLSWNLMQRGLAGNPGGQWKMSLVNERSGRVKAQCVVRDEANRFLRVNSSTEIRPGEPSAISCFFDDRKNELSVDVDGRTDQASAVVRKPVDGTEVVVFDTTRGITEEEFGTSNPNGGGTCGGALPDGIGNTITIGNKPACGVTLEADDRFQGRIERALIWKLR